MHEPEEQWPLEDVIATDRLRERKVRISDLQGESKVTTNLLRELARAPEEFFPTLVAAILELSNAGSAGISILNEDQRRFVWPAVTGGLAPYVGSGTPSDFGPCGTVLDQDAAILFIHPERHFTYLLPITPSLEEVLLNPFHVDGKAVGTIWAVIHEPGRHFDSEDRRLLANLSRFASSAYQALGKAGALRTIHTMKPDTQPPAERHLTQEEGKWRFTDDADGIAAQP